MNGEDWRAWRRGRPRVPVPPIRATLLMDILGSIIHGVLGDLVLDVLLVGTWD